MCFKMQALLKATAVEHRLRLSLALSRHLAAAAALHEQGLLCNAPWRVACALKLRQIVKTEAAANSYIKLYYPLPPLPPLPPQPQEPQEPQQPQQHKHHPNYTYHK